METAKVLNIDSFIKPEALKTFAAVVLQRAGVPSEQASDAADVLVWASLRGVDTHGIRNLKRYYVDGITKGEIQARGEFRTEYETAISARADGDRGLGLSAACWGMRLAIAKAAESGVGFVSMRNSNHLGAAGYYAHMAVEHNMVGICMSGNLYAEGNDIGMPPVFCHAKCSLR